MAKPRETGLSQEHPKAVPCAEEGTGPIETSDCINDQKQIFWHCFLIEMDLDGDMNITVI